MGERQVIRGYHEEIDFRLNFLRTRAPGQWFHYVAFGGSMDLQGGTHVPCMLDGVNEKTVRIRVLDKTGCPRVTSVSPLWLHSHCEGYRRHFSVVGS